MGSWWDSYWNWAGSNIGAMPAEFVITVAVTLVFQKPIARFLAWLRRKEAPELVKARQEAEAARQIAADLYRHVTGHDHPYQAGE